MTYIYNKGKQMNILNEVEQSDQLLTAFHLVLSDTALMYIFKESDLASKVKDCFNRGELTDDMIECWLLEKKQHWVQGYSFPYEYVLLLLMLSLEQSELMGRIKQILIDRPIMEMRRTCYILEIIKKNKL